MSKDNEVSGVDSIERKPLSHNTGVFLPPRIAKEFDGILQKRLTVVEAAAGYGKTTLLKHWAEKRNIAYVWLDQDLGELDWAELLSSLEKGSGVLVFDNWQKTLGRQPREINYLLRSIPSNIHSVLCGRTAPSLLLSGFQPKDVLRIDEKILAFTPHEVSAFLARHYNTVLPPEQIERLRQETEGWPLGLSLAGKIMCAKPGHWNLEQIAQDCNQQISAYFLAEVFGNLPPAKQECLLAFGMADEISEQVFSPLLGPEIFRNNLQWAKDNHLFLSDTDGALRFHCLFLRFLRSIFVKRGRQYSDLAQKVGRRYLELMQPVQAIACLVRAAAFEEAGEALEKLAPDLLRDNRLDTLAGLLAQIPTEADRHLPNALLAFGERLAAGGKGQAALNWLKRASFGFGQIEECLGITRSLCAMGMVYADLGLREEAEAVYKQARQEASSDNTSKGVVAAYVMRFRQLEASSSEPSGIPKLRLQCLGDFELFRGNQRLDCRGWRRKALLVLKYLALHPSHSASKDQLLELFWLGDFTEKANNSYYVTLHSLRRGLEDGLTKEANYLEVQRGTVRLVPELLAGLDIDEFMFMHQEGLRLWPSNRPHAAEHFQAAVNLYRGDLLNQDLYEEWVSPLRDQLRGRYFESLAFMAKFAAGIGEMENALGVWNQILVSDATNEYAAREAMELLRTLGRRSEALHCYQRLERRLREELDTSPEPETQRLYQTLLRTS